MENTDEGDWIPKQNARLAAKSKFRASKPEAQARHVMLKKLGLVVQNEVPYEASFDEFQCYSEVPARFINKGDNAGSVPWQEAGGTGCC